MVFLFCFLTGLQTEGTRKVGPKEIQRRERMLCHYMAGSSNFAINYDYSQPAEMCPYNTAFNPESTWLSFPFSIH